jgi:hypothetical protein
MTAYDAQAWSLFALATVGASAALTGLLLVAAAVTFDRIGRRPQLPGRAAMTLCVLVSVLAVSLCVLVPDQSQVALGVEIALTGLVLGIAAVTWVSRAPQHPGEPSGGTLVPTLLALAPALALVVGGLSLEAGAGGGLYWVFAACVLGIGSAVLESWLVLLESHR